MVPARPVLDLNRLWDTDGLGQTLQTCPEAQLDLGPIESQPP